MKIAIAQLDIVWEDKEANREQCTAAVLAAKKGGALLIVFPEMTLTGFSMNTEYAEAEGGETTVFFRQLAESHSIAIVYGAMVRATDGRALNRLVWLNSKGETVLFYDKLHPFSYAKEDQYFAPGDSVVEGVFEQKIVSAFVCYDLRFPEIFTAVSRKATFIVVIANWPAKRDLHWRTLLQARAIENQAFIVGVNRTGKGGGLDYCGSSLVVSPRGEIIFDGGSRARVKLAEFDLSDADKWRQEFPMKQDRRSELYRTFY